MYNAPFTPHDLAEVQRWSHRSAAESDADSSVVGIDLTYRRPTNQIVLSCACPLAVRLFVGLRRLRCPQAKGFGSMER